MAPVNATILLLGEEGPLPRRLRDEGLGVQVEDSVPAALAVLEHRPVDLVLADLAFATPAFVAEVRRRRDLPVVALGATTGQQVVDLLKAGAAECITREMDLEVALARVEGLLRRRGWEPGDGPFRAEPGAMWGAYRIEGSLGHGGMGDVYRAVDERLGRPVALKILPGELASRPEISARFTREARALARLKHPGIVAIWDAGERPLPYLVMELLEGEDLAHRLERGVLDVPEAARVVRDAARILEAVHAGGILHRDLKPSNLMLQPDGQVRLLDFGLARLLDDDFRLTTGGTVLGTPAYMAPEQVDAGMGEVDARTDVYALGLVLYEALAGRVPFRDDGLLALLREITSGSPISLARARPDVPPDLDRICRRATERRKSSRYPSAGALADDLDRFLVALHEA